MARALGLGAVLKFTGGAAVAGMNRAGKAAQAMSKRFDRVRASSAMMAGGMRTLAIAGLALTVVLGAMTAKAANFEQQMANIAAVAVDATGPELKELTSLAKELGATTAFTAVQAGEAMELLTRAGFDVNQVMAATPAVLSAAAAEGIGLAEAADMVAKSLKIMGLEADQAGRVADVLALTSAKANTNMVMLGEAMKFGGGQAATLGFTIEETAAILGKLADAGLQASLGGTSLNAMLVKLTKPTGKATAFMDKHKISLTKVGEAGELVFKKMPALVKEFTKGLDTIADPAEKAAIVTELFGIRGAKAFNALARSGGDALEQLTQQLEDASGAAARMAAIRLDTFKGQLTLLQSAVEGFSIEIGSLLLPTLTEGMKRASKFIGELAVGLGMVLNPAKANTKEAERQKKRWGELGAVAKEVVMGMWSGIDKLRKWWGKLTKVISGVVKVLGVQLGGKEGIGNIARMGTMIVAVAAVAAPVLMALMGVFILLAAAVKIVVGLVGILAAVFWPVTVVLGILIGAVMLFKKENESTWGATIRIVKKVWKVLKSFAKGVYKGFSKMIQPIQEVAMPALDELRGLIKILGKTFDKFFKSTGTDAATWALILGQTIGATVGGAISLVITLIGTLIQSFVAVGTAIGYLASLIVRAVTVIVSHFGFIMAPITAMKTALKAVAQLVTGDFAGAWATAKEGIVKIGQAMLGPLLKIYSTVKKIIQGLKDIGKQGSRIDYPGGISVDAGASGPLPVSPGPTPPTIASTPSPDLAATSAPAGESTMVVHTHVMLDGREVASSVERFKSERKMRAATVSPGQLREFADITSAA